MKLLTRILMYREGLLAFLRRKIVRIPSAIAIVPFLIRLKMINLCSSRSILGSAPTVVSLTTYGRRAKVVFLTIESIGRGSVKPAQMILWIDDPRIYKNPSRSLRRLISRGLDIRPTENFGPYKKFYPLVRAGTSYQSFVTADDDVVYPRHWLRELLLSFVEDPESIHCYRAHVVQLTSSGIGQYSSWPTCTTTAASLLNFATGVSGVLYPVETMGHHLRDAGEKFRVLCPTADDLWLHRIAVANGIKIRQISPDSKLFPIVPGTQARALSVTNTIHGANDKQIRNLYDAGVIRMLKTAATEHRLSLQRVRTHR